MTEVALVVRTLESSKGTANLGVEERGRGLSEREEAKREKERISG